LPVDFGATPVPLAYMRQQPFGLAHVRANLNRSGGLRDDGLAGGLANQKQEGENQTHMPLIGGLA
jgi:hypothetical protein